MQEQDYIPTTRKTEADFGVCKECGHLITQSIFWGLGQIEWLHKSGTGHKKFRWFKFIWS